MSKNLELMNENKIIVLKRNLELFPDVLDKEPRILKRISDYYFELFLVNIKKTKFILALKKLKESIKHRPLWLTPLVYIYYNKLK